MRLSLSPLVMEALIDKLHGALWGSLAGDALVRTSAYCIWAWASLHGSCIPVAPRTCILRLGFGVFHVCAWGLSSDHPPTHSSTPIQKRHVLRIGTTIHGSSSKILAPSRTTRRPSPLFPAPS